MPPGPLYLGKGGLPAWFLMGVGGKGLPSLAQVFERLHPWQALPAAPALLPLPGWIMQISGAGVPRCRLETKERGSGASPSTGNPRPCLPCWPCSCGLALGGVARMPTEGRRGLHGALSRVKVHREWGRGVIQELFPEAVNF